MAANTSPLFPLTPNTGWVNTLTAANTAMDGTGTVSTVYTAGTNGSVVDRIRVKPQGTNVATVLRVFVNNGSTNATVANNTLIDEITIPSTTASNSAGLPTYELPLKLPLANGYKVNVAIGTAVSAGLSVTGIGGDY